MTKKRFELTKSDITDFRVYDYKREDAYFLDCDSHTGECIVDLLNALHEENEQLRILTNIKNTNAKDIVDVLNIQENNIWDLKKENEKLKQQVKELKHWNKCLAEKRHQELSYGYYTNSKAEKDLRDLLEPKLFNCSDR